MGVDHQTKLIECHADFKFYGSLKISIKHIGGHFAKKNAPLTLYIISVDAIGTKT